MERFKLTQDLLTGVNAIDDQHRALLELGNNVMDAFINDKGAAVFQEALLFLDGYVIYHFAAEEHVMRGVGYPRFESHRQWHERFRKEISDFASQAQAVGSSKDLVTGFTLAFENWLLEHIRIIDRDLARFLKEKKDGAKILLPDIKTLKKSGAIPEDLDERFLQGFGSR